MPSRAAELTVSKRRAAAPTPELASKVREAIARLSRCFRVQDLPGGLTHERLSALSVIAARGPIAVSALAETEMVSRATMSRMISGLESEGLVKRREQKDDRRGVLISITARGRRIYQRAVKQSLTDVVSAIGSLDSEHLAALRLLLDAVEREIAAS